MLIEADNSHATDMRRHLSRSFRSYAAIIRAMLRSLSSLTGALLLSSFAAGAGNWPQFRGPSASGLGDGSPPLEWNGEKGINVRWKTEIPGLGYSSPVIWGDRIFLTTAVPLTGAASVKLGLYGDIQPVQNEGQQSFQVHCLDRKSGKVLWKQTAATGDPKVKRHPKSSHANPTPATDGKYLAVFFGSEGLYVYNLDGKLLWKKDLGVLDAGFYVVPDAQWGFASSPVIHDGKVIVQADVQKNSFLAAFDAKDGKELWRTPRQDVPTFGTPTVGPAGGSQKQIVVNGWKHIGGYDVNTGKEIWKMAGGGDIPVPTPVFANNLIVITNAHGNGRPIYAIRADAKGDLNQDRSGIAWVQDRVGNYMQTPLLADGLGYFCFDNGVCQCLSWRAVRGSTSSGWAAAPRDFRVRRSRPPDACM